VNERYHIESGVVSHQLIELLEDRIYEHNSSVTNKYDGHLFSRIVKNENKEIIAGIAGWTWAGICEITQLWVSENHRQNGIGRMLLEAAESEAKTKGCVSILVRSYSFQAPHFYEKYGYHAHYILNGFPEGYNYYILVKTIARTLLRH
jgi:ribosomal protein S18 acetylase RimI-like enzyme